MTALDIHRPEQAPVTTGIHESDAHRLARLAPQYDGLEFLAAIKRGELPAPPIAQLLGFEIATLATGEVTFALTPTEALYNPIGTVHGGVHATLLDTVMGCAVQTRLPRGTSYTTLDLSVRYLRAVTTDTDTVIATGWVVHLGRRTATAEATLKQQSSGLLLATATSTLLVSRP